MSHKMYYPFTLRAEIADAEGVTVDALETAIARVDKAVGAEGDVYGTEVRWPVSVLASCWGDAESDFGNTLVDLEAIPQFANWRLDAMQES